MVKAYRQQIEHWQWYERNASSFADFQGCPSPTEETKRLIEAGLTDWENPVFCEYATSIVSDYYSRGGFEIAKFIAGFLLESMPDNLFMPIDRAEECESWRAYYEAIVDGTLPLSDLSRFCQYPQKSEFYRKTLNWKMTEYAEDTQAFRRASTNTFIAMYATGRGEEAAKAGVERVCRGEA